MKKIIMISSIVGGIAIIVAMLYIGGYNLKPVPTPGANATGTTQELQLVTVSALDNTRSTIGPLIENQTFQVNNAVYLQANFSNPNIDSSEHAIIGEISGPSGTSSLSQVQATLGARGQLSLEIYWNPTVAGQYTFLLIQDLPDQPDTEITQPLARIKLQVIEVVQ